APAAGGHTEVPGHVRLPEDRSGRRRAADDGMGARVGGDGEASDRTQLQLVGATQEPLVRVGYFEEPLTQADQSDPWARLARDLRRNHGVSRAVLAVYRFGTWAHRSGARSLLMPLYRLVDLVVVKLLAGADLPAECEIG